MSERAKGLSRQQMCDRLAMEFEDGWIVNLGIGIPTLCSNFDFGDKEIIFHSENGVIGYGPLAAPGEEALHLVNAGGQHVTLRPGAAIVHRANSFALIRAGRLDVTVLGAYEVAENGDSYRGPARRVTELTRRGRTGLLVVVGGRGDLQLCTDRLDPPATPTGFVVPVGVDEGNYLFCRRSSSAPKKVAAACKMSLARCNSKFSLRSRFSSSRSSVVRPGRVPASMSACFTHVRSDSPPTPSCRATLEMTFLSRGSACCSSRTMRTARSFNSDGYLFPF